ncbi:MAG: BON domain-containing protein [Pyrinomonadaceae bacterium]|jgi:hypothetical protein|nr:BON domain-containing protein [Pyrinomonadaceae bacterium]
MLKNAKNLLFILIAVISFSVINVSAQSAKQFETKVGKELRKLPYYGVFDFISYKVDGNNVTLFGKVAVARNKKDAEAFVKDIKGIGNVVNNIEILPLSSFDDSIRRQIIRSINQTGGLSRYFWEPNPDVRIIVNRGRVTFEGIVVNQTDVNLLRIATNQVLGVFEVTSNLKVKATS